MNKPLLICLTPIRNEAWILHAFLKATSLWADYIIIADQGSTDGSREIALSYPKVILIDNNNPDFNEAERQKMLIDKARGIIGEKILFGLDADEIFTANFIETNDWQKILNSKQGDVFWFRWANICPDLKHYWAPETSFPWMFHDDGVEPHGNYVRNMHSMRIPYPFEERQMFYVNDFKVLHLAYLFSDRVEAKFRFYKFIDYEMNKRSSITLSRSYKQSKVKEEILSISDQWIYSKMTNGFDLFSCIDIQNLRFWFDKYIVDRFEKNGTNPYKKIDIWQNSFVQEYSLNDPRSIWVKFIHYYLQKTQTNYDVFPIKIIDKILRKIGI